MRKSEEGTVRRRAFGAGALVLAAVTAIAARGTGRADGRGTGGERDGEALYAKNCSSCHGDSGRGDGPTGLILKQKPVDLRSAEVRKMTDDELFARITDGKAPMPGFGARLSADDRRALVRYVRGLAATGP